MVRAQNFGYIPRIINPDATVGGNIEIYENVWNDCPQLISAIEDLCSDKNSGINWNKATTIGDGAFQNYRTNWDMGITWYANVFRNPLMITLHHRLNDLINSAATSYSERNNIKEDFWQEGYNILKYDGGQEYKNHYDSASGTGRHISCILYLNQDYQGGEIEFPAFGIKIKPQTGMLILFPSNYAYGHIAHPVISGTKYAIVTWLHDRPV